MQFWPPDDEHMCLKHVEAWNKLIVKQKFCASSWLVTEIKKNCHSSLIHMELLQISYYLNQLYVNPTLIHVKAVLYWKTQIHFTASNQISPRIHLRKSCWITNEDNLTTVHQDATVFSLLHFCRQLYMFRMLTRTIRSWYSCNYSFCYWLTAMSKIRCN